MGKFKVVITDREYENIDNELRILKQIDADVYDYQLRDPHEIAKVAADADAVIFQYANITRELIEQMPKCKIIAKYAAALTAWTLPPPQSMASTIPCAGLLHR